MASIEEIDKLDRAALAALFNREVIALVFRAYCGQSVAKKLANWFEQHPARTNYRWANARGILQESDTERVGIPLNELYPIFLSSAPADESYKDLLATFNDFANDHIRTIRDVCCPHIPPIDELRLRLDEEWPLGAHIARFANVRPYVGIARIMSADVKRPREVDPHLDWLPTPIKSLDEQFSGIVYLEVPEIGGELELWDIDRDRMMRLIEEHDALRRIDLPPPAIVRPQCGDLVLINTRYPHAVRGFRSGRRIVQTSFIGLGGQNPLLLWS
jgi:2OG-Fe(II) oxygenase superfamily